MVWEVVQIQRKVAVGARRMRYELAKTCTGLDLGNNPDAWEAWFRVHPDLIWDAGQKRLLDPVKP